MGRGEAESAVNFDAELHIEMLNEPKCIRLASLTAVATCESNIQVFGQKN